MEPTAHFNRVEHPCRASRSLTVSIPYFSPGSSLTLSLFLSLCLTLTRSPNLSLPFILTISRFLNILLCSLSLSLSLMHSPSWCPNKFVNPTEKKDTRHVLQFRTVCVCSGGTEGATYPKIAEKTFGTGCFGIVSGNVSKGFEIFTRRIECVYGSSQLRCPLSTSIHDIDYHLL